MQVINRAVIILVDRHLLGRLAMQDRKAIVHLDLRLGARTEERAYHALLRVLPPEVVVEDVEQHDGVDYHVLNGPSENQCDGMSYTLIFLCISESNNDLRWIGSGP